MLYEEIIATIVREIAKVSPWGFKMTAIPGQPHYREFAFTAAGRTHLVSFDIYDESLARKGQARAAVRERILDVVNDHPDFNPQTD